MSNPTNNIKLFIIIFSILWITIIFYFINSSSDNIVKTENKTTTNNNKVEEIVKLEPGVHPDLTNLPEWDRWAEITKEQREQQLIENKLDEVLVNKISAYLRTFCRSYKDVNSLAKSSHFKNLREKVKNFSKRDDNFMYVQLPSMVYDQCKWKDFDYLESLILFLQSSDENLKNLNAWVAQEALVKYIKDLSFKDTNIPKDIRSNSESFNKYFLKDNIEDLSAFYYPYHVKEQENLTNYVNRPLITLQDENNNKKLAVGLMIGQLEEMWFASFDEFKHTLMRNNGFANVEELKASLISDYNSIISLNPDIKKDLDNLADFKKFITSKSYKDLYNDEKTVNLINNIWKNMLIFSIINPDYADWLWEVWSWLNFFWDEKVWNWIIRIHFLYMLNL